MVERRVLLIALAMLIVFSTSALIVHSTSDPAFLLSPGGTLRVALHSMGGAEGGNATWYPIAPRVFDGSFSALLYSGTVSGDGGAILLGPVSFPLSDLTNDRITFWTYHFNNNSKQPHVNIVLDNGRTLEGKNSTTVDGSPIKCEKTGAGSGCQGYPSADIWVQMMPKDQFFTSFPADPVLAPVASCTIGSPCPLATWITAFPTANVIQIQIVYDFSSVGSGFVIFIDDVAIFPNGSSIIAPIEPETVSSSDQ